MFNLIPFLKNYIYLCDQNIDKFSLIELSNNLPSSTFKKKLIKTYIKINAKLCTYKFSSKINDKNLINLIGSYVEKQNNYLIFSQDLRTRKRLYVLKKDKKNDVNFVKIIWGKEQNNVQNEKLCYSLLKNVNNFDFIIANKINRLDKYLIVEYSLLPKKAKLLKIKPILIYDYLCEINLKNDLIHLVNTLTLYKTDWWIVFKSLKGIDGFLNYCDSILKNKVEYKLCWCHGDLGSENVFFLEDRFILIDWEKSRFDAPIITDYLGIVLGNNSDSLIKNKLKHKNHKDLISFYDNEIGNRFEYEDFLLGLIFYLATNFNLSFYLINNFESE